MSSNPALDRVVRIFEHKAVAGSNELLLESLADDMRWTIAGSSCLSRTYEGKGDFVDNCLGALSGRVRPGIRCHVQSIQAAGDDVVVRWKGEAQTVWGEPYHNDYCWIVSFRGDRIHEVTAYVDTLLVEQVMTHPI
jgi:ketosteroid isomerase-like protein